MSRAIVLFVALATSVSAAGDITLEDVRQASNAASTNPKSARCSGTFNVTKQNSDDDEAVLWTVGTFKLLYAPGKVLLDIEFKTEKRQVVTIAPDGSESEPRIVDSPTDRVVILSDGETVYKITYTPRIRPSGCQIELYSTISTAISTSSFPLRDPVRPHLGVLNITKLVENLGLDAIDWSRSDGTLFRGVYHAKNSPNTRAVFHVDTAIGSHLVAHSVFNLPSEVPAVAQTMKWAQSKGTQYVQEIEVTKRYSKQPIQKEKIVYASYEPGIAIPQREFDISTIQIPPRTRTIDRR